MDTSEEKPIISRAREGDREAFGTLYDQYEPQLYRFVLLKVSSRGDAEDITHQVFMNAWLNIRDYRDLGFPFSSWLYRMARNQVIDYYRTKKDAVPIDEMGEDEAPEDSLDLGAHVDLKLLRSEMRKAIRSLRPHYQDVLIMRFVEDMSIREVAQAMRKSEGSIKLMQHRAVQELRKIIGNLPFFTS